MEPIAPKPKRSGKPDGKDRDGKQHMPLPRIVLMAPKFIALSPSAVKLLFDLCAQWSGWNNGDLSAAMSILRPRGWKSASTLARSLNELLAAGFIARTRFGNRNRCALFGLTWMGLNADKVAQKLDAQLCVEFPRGAYLRQDYTPTTPKAPAFRPGQRKFCATENVAVVSRLLLNLEQSKIHKPPLLRNLEQSGELCDATASNFGHLSREPSTGACRPRKDKQAKGRPRGQNRALETEET